jgi:tRNA dimethylallyltransferase
VSPPLLGIVGPTASGKTELALALAGALPVEIVVADSRQVYRGMNVGTAKVAADVRRRVPHHLLDIVDPDEPFTVADWVGRARAVIAEIAGRGRLPMLVGGTGLYVAALVDGHDYAAQPWSPELRQRLADELEAGGLDPLIARLESIDPAAAGTIDLRNPRRVLRALERAEAGGGGVSPRAESYPGRVALIGLDRPREVLYRRIDARAAWIFEHGLLDEVRALRAAGFGPQLHPMTGHGYAEAAGLLAGELTLDEAVATTARRTRQYAKRQLTWFRRDPRLPWVPAGDGAADASEIVERAERVLRAAIS